MPQNGFEERWHTFGNCGALARKMAYFQMHFRDDGTLERKKSQFLDCGTLGTIAVRPSKCSAHK